MPVSSLVFDNSTSEKLKWGSRRSPLKEVVYVIHKTHCDVINTARASNAIHHVIHVLLTSCNTSYVISYEHRGYGKIVRHSGNMERVMPWSVFSSRMRVMHGITHVSQDKHQFEALLICRQMLLFS